MIIKVHIMKSNKWTAEDDKVNQAIIFAVEKHKCQKRKGTDYPYIVHPLEVLSILAAMEMNKDVLIAGVLHDVVEDTDTSLSDIKSMFGDNVATLVAGHTDDKTLPWQERKEKALAELRVASYEVKCLTLADKLSNMRAIARDYKAVGDEVWNKFTKPKENQRWYYAGGIEALVELKGRPNTEPFFNELEELYKDVFVQYYYVKDENIFAKGIGLSENYLYKNGEWVEDHEHIVSDRLMGYDPYEDDDSPYKIGNTEIMLQLEKITKEEFERRVNVIK